MLCVPSGILRVQSVLIGRVVSFSLLVLVGLLVLGQWCGPRAMMVVVLILFVAQRCLSSLGIGGECYQSVVVLLFSLLRSLVWHVLVGVGSRLWLHRRPLALWVAD